MNSPGRSEFLELISCVYENTTKAAASNIYAYFLILENIILNWSMKVDMGIGTSAEDSRTGCHIPVLSYVVSIDTKYDSYRMTVPVESEYFDYILSESVIRASYKSGVIFYGEYLEVIIDMINTYHPNIIKERLDKEISLISYDTIEEYDEKLKVAMNKYQAELKNICKQKLVSLFEQYDTSLDTVIDTWNEYQIVKIHYS